MIDSPKTSPTPQRSGPVDALRAWAMAGVLLIHTSAAGLGGDVGTPDWYGALFWNSVSRASVPIFLMLTGALLLDPSRPLSLRRLWLGRIPRLLAPLLTWAMVYRLWQLWRWGGGITPARVLEAVKQTLAFHHQNHLYYLHIALLVYALLPALRPLAQVDRRTLEYLLGLWVALGILYPTLRGVWPLTLLRGIPVQYGLNLAYAGAGYALLGWYLRQYARRPRAWALMAAAGFLVIFVGTAILSLRDGGLNGALLEGCAPGAALLAAGSCGWVFTALRDWSAPRAVEVLSRASFCVYLVHLLPLWELGRLGVRWTAGPCWLSVPLTAAAVLACSLAVWAVLRRVPVVRDWLI